MYLFSWLVMGRVTNMFMNQAAGAMSFEIVGVWLQVSQVIFFALSLPLSRTRLSPLCFRIRGAGAGARIGLVFGKITPSGPAVATTTNCFGRFFVSGGEDVQSGGRWATIFGDGGTVHGAARGPSVKAPEEGRRWRCEPSVVGAIGLATFWLPLSAGGGGGGGKFRGRRTAAPFPPRALKISP